MGKWSLLFRRNLSPSSSRVWIVPSTLEDKAAHSIKMSGTAYPGSHPEREAPEFLKVLHLWGFLHDYRL